MEKFINSAVMTDGEFALPINQLINANNYLEAINPNSIDMAARMIMRGAEIGLTFKRMFNLNVEGLERLSFLSQLISSSEAMAAIQNNTQAADVFSRVEDDVIARVLSEILGFASNAFPNMATIVNSNVAMSEVVNSDIAMRAIVNSNIALSAISTNTEAFNSVVSSPISMSIVANSRRALLAVAGNFVFQNSQVAVSALSESTLRQTATFPISNTLTNRRSGNIWMISQRQSLIASGNGTYQLRRVMGTTLGTAENTIIQTAAETFNTDAPVSRFFVQIENVTTGTTGDVTYTFIAL